jgi:hypothetical protein
MHNLNEDVEKAMRVLSELSTRAKRLGADDTFYAANRAWHELHNLNRAPAKDSSDAS